MTTAVANDHPDYVTVSFDMSGFFAVLVTWSGEFYQPWNTGFGRYETGKEANVEAFQWAQTEGVEYRPDLMFSMRQLLKT